MPEVVSFTRESNAEIVEELERLLDEAKRGEIIGLAFALERPGSYTAHGWKRSPLGNGHVMCAAIRYLDHRFTAGMVEGSTEEANA